MGRPKKEASFDANAKEQSTQHEIKPKRIYTEDMEIDSDLFKLEVSKMLKNQSWNDQKPILEPVEHCHFFRTYDSNGKRQSTSNSVGGHYHDIEVSMNDQGDFVATASGPKFKAGRTNKFNDTHTHKVTYHKSSKVMKRQISSEAQKVIDFYQRPAYDNTSDQ